MQKGNIGVTTENIFPVIKKFLYSDHEIFLREIVSNAIDATQKLKTLAQSGEFKDELGDLTVHVKLEKDTLTISDRGIGMTAEEIDKYINQIAFSGANDFLEKYKNDANAIIGHFGLGFYSAFMVSKKVEIITKSYKQDAKAAHWTCDGSPSFVLEDSDKADRGTDIILHIDDDCREFLQESRISELLNKYCRFLPVPIAFGKKKEWKDGKQVETAEDLIVNDVDPLWTKRPADLKDEDYKKFYHDLYPMADDPLFWIHLNVDYPFHLTGILYFPKVHRHVELQKNKIQLYCNQVFVTDIVEGIVPEFMTLLHGVIDSPDIPLNVSRSYLQSDSNVKKISTYITKKVADRLDQIFKDNRSEFEQKWDNLRIFINFGMLTQEDFYERATKFNLLKDTEGKYYTLDEYKELIKGEQTDKDGSIVYLYANNKDEQYSFIQAANNKGYNVLLMDGEIDVAVVNMLEQKLDKTRFVRVDSDTVERLIPKKDSTKDELEKAENSLLSTMFSSQLPKNEKMDFHVMTESMGENNEPIIITQSEYMRRMKDMANIQAGMGYYGQMPDMYTVVLNSDHHLIKDLLNKAEESCKAALTPIDVEMTTIRKRHDELWAARQGKKDDEVPQSEKDELDNINKTLNEKKTQKDAIITEYAKDNQIVHQLIDLALLQNNLLKGEALSEFIKRSVNMIKE
ncbi:MAG: molecular chaperone HtpG [Phocaeicola sp.]|uniref:molecular chaperone HtpG n=1 Tax=Phocaeicola TaxID=909656 RepID=UPI00234EB3B4|nr:molecular chaperone HtpG [Phocaeicola oris]MCE2615526.1 molecular chaperone HtpG [Phocaeicola oris]